METMLLPNEFGSSVNNMGLNGENEVAKKKRFFAPHVTFERMHCGTQTSKTSNNNSSSSNNSSNNTKETRGWIGLG